ncbi:MAG TPA: PfkB family carbohydrate kinase, partial [Terriglobales bacterium]|nr:PfkB family carbohydrate kinase [Terriglobales bacterium]
MDQIEVVVCGHLCLDIVSDMEQIPLTALGVPGRLYESGKLSLTTGGSVSNTGLALHRLGIRTHLMGNVGDDLVGQNVKQILAARDPALGESIKVLPGEFSSATIVLTPHQVDRVFLYFVGPNGTFGRERVDWPVVEKTQIFHLGYPSLLPRLFADDGAEMLAILERAKSSGAVTSVDMTLPDAQRPSGQADWWKIFARTLPYTDIFIPSIEEGLFCLRRADFDAWEGNILEHITAGYLSDLADEMIEMGGVIVGFKLGHLGFYVKTAQAEPFERLQRLHLNVAEWAGRTVWSPAFQVEVAGTTGAGDAAYAGFLAGLVRGRTPADAVRWACAVGACNVE